MENALERTMWWPLVLRRAWNGFCSLFIKVDKAERETMDFHLLIYWLHALTGVPQWETIRNLWTHNRDHYFENVIKRTRNGHKSRHHWLKNRDFDCYAINAVQGLYVKQALNGMVLASKGGHLNTGKLDQAEHGIPSFLLLCAVETGLCDCSTSISNLDVGTSSLSTVERN